MSRLLLHQRSLLLRQSHPTRLFSTNPSLQTTFQPTPSPPRLPPKEQEEFERLQRSSTGAFSSTSTSTSTSTSSSTSMSTTAGPSVSPTSTSPPTSTPPLSPSPTLKSQTAHEGVKEALGEERQIHPDARARLKREFEGDRNPKTGETGGPKQDPVRWGSDGVRGDWSFGGRVSDF